MDGNGNFRNWAYYERPAPAAFKSHLGLQLMAPLDSEKPLLGGRDQHPILGGRDQHHLLGGRDQHHHYHHAALAAMNGSTFRHHRVGVSESPIPMDYMRNGWINHGDKYLNLQHNYAVIPETSAANPVHMLQQTNLMKNECENEMQEETGADAEGEPPNNSSGGKVRKLKKAKKARAPRDECSPAVQRARTPKKSTEVFINGIDMDISRIPIPVCSCTGTRQQCYRWGSGGWQSACCTTTMSTYPLPMSTKRRGARIAGRKMSLGAFTKVLEKLSSENYDFTDPIDLRMHWARHGTNKFVTIR